MSSKSYLKNLFKTTYFADIIERNKIYKNENLDEVCSLISTCTGQLLENVVYNELKFSKYDVRIGSFDSVEKKDNMSIRKTYEVDFYATKGRNRFYIQVANDLSNVETKMREIRPFILLNSQVRKVIVVNKPIKETFDENGFTIIGAVDFLLRFIK